MKTLVNYNTREKLHSKANERLSSPYNSRFRTLSSLAELIDISDVNRKKIARS